MGWGSVEALSSRPPASAKTSTCRWEGEPCPGSMLGAAGWRSVSPASWKVLGKLMSFVTKILHPRSSFLGTEPCGRRAGTGEQERRGWDWN